VSQTHRVDVDVARLADAMRTEGLDVNGVLRLDRIGDGQSNLTYHAVDERKNSWIVRRPPLGELLASAHDVVREYRILKALAGTEVPVPAVHCALPPGSVAEVPVVVMAYVAGHVVDGFDGLGNLTPDARRTLTRDLSEVLAQVHGVVLEEVGLKDLASHAPYAPRQLKRWATQWEVSRTRDLAPLDELTELLWRNAPSRTAIALIHGDFSLRNLITDGNTGKIRAVLDWELSTLGDPLADVGTTLAYWTVSDHGAAAGAVAPVPHEERAEFVRAYLQASRRDGTDIPYWHTLGLWKLAIIAEGVIRRGQNTPANAAATGLPTIAEVDRFVAVARRIARDSGMV